MLSTEIIAERVADWLREILPELNEAYDHAAERKTAPLPDAAVEITDIEIRERDDRFPLFNFQNVTVKSYQYDVLLMVDPADPEAASDLLASFADRILAAIAADQTLGARVPAVALGARITFNPPFVRFDDGTKGRLATARIVVGEPIPIEE